MRMIQTLRRCSTFIKWTGELLPMPWWQHNKHYLYCHYFVHQQTRTQDHRGRHSKIFGWAKSLPLPRLTFRLLYLSFPSSFPSPPFPVVVGPLSTARGLGSAVSFPSGVWGGAQRKANLVYFSLKTWHLVAPILLIFLRINDHTCQLLVGPNALWHCGPTQPKFGWAITHLAHSVAPHDPLTNFEFLQITRPPWPR